MNKYKYLINVAGYKKEDISVEYQKTRAGGLFHVSAENKEFGLKEAVATVAEDIDNESITAKVENGYLYINWNVPKEKQPLSITVA